ncbi:MAG: aspartate/glutamate racemase family protein [Chlamydiae bacterium]|nr:aspartate/glutamate racemase family protein [Chlamydiota bacterium]
MKSENNYINSKPIIGLIGGCGPYATLDIEQKILLATHSFLSPTKDQDYYPMLVFHNTQLEDRTLAKESYGLELKNQIKAVIENLISMNVDILLLACQSAHVYLNDIRPNLDKVFFLDIIKVTTKHILSSPKKWKRIGLMGTNVLYESKLYQTELKAHGVEVIIPSDSLQEHIMQVIYTIKMYGTSFLTNQLNESHFKINSHKNINASPHCVPLKKITDPLKHIISTINYLKDQNVDAIILGCTELPLLLPYLMHYFSENIFIDSNRLIAEEVVLCAAEIEKSSNKNFM